jgi:hypothetical protein
MMKKIFTSVFVLLAATCLNAQNIQNPSNEDPCGTQMPSQQWDVWFNEQVEIYKENLRQNKVMPQQYVIPIIVHIIHGGQPVGTFPNIDSAQVRTQLTALNNDFAGTGFNTNTIPSVFQAVKANTDVQFCLAVKNPTGGILTEPGIDRINYQTNNWANPASQNGNTAIKNLIDNTVKPATIWDPTKYFNIWISDRGTGGLLGYATFPAGTNLPGITANFAGTATSDGVWVWTKSFGTVGNLYAGFTRGRVLAHEAGHWLGLRHVWGDGNCLNDFCNDTPPAPHNHGAANPVHPFHVNQCGPNQSPNGEMFMNFMDYTKTDDIMCMFTNDQKTRIQTAMSQGSFRALLGTHGLCATAASTPAPATAQFSLATAPCAGKPFNVINQSTGGPTPTFNWSTNPATNVTIAPAPTAAAPSIIFGAPGTYTLSLVATNSVNTSTYTSVLTVTACPFEPVCLDSIRAIRPTDTLTLYQAPSNTLVLGCGPTNLNRGWISGTNCYKDREKAQFYPASSYSATSNPQINSLLVLFDTVGTKGNPNTQILAKIWGHSSVLGAPSSSLIAQTQDSLLTILTNTATNNVPFVGNPLHTQASPRIKVHSFDFIPPVPLPTGGFYASVQMPYATPNDSVLIFSNTYANSINDSSGWVMSFISNNWERIKSKYGKGVKLAIIPQITCRNAVGVKEESLLSAYLHIFPNPSTGVINIATSFNSPKNLQIEWFDCVGRLIEHTEHNGILAQMFTSDLSEKPNGVYFVKLKSESQQSTYKVILLK